MTLNLSTLAILLGLVFGLPQVYGLARPTAFGVAVRKFPRSLPWGIALMLLGSGWFVWNVSQESISDFTSIKTPLLLFFTAVGIGSCLFVQDFLAVRGLAVVLLLVAKVMVDAGRPYLPSTAWVLLIQTWAYVLVVAGLWLTVSPWRLRDFLNWGTATEKRIKIGCSLRLAFGLFVAALGFIKF